MSRLRIYADDRPDQALATWTVPNDIARELDACGVRFEQWQASAPIEPGASQEAVIAAYRDDIDRFDGGAYGFTSLEGYLAARLFTQALALCPELSTESLRQTLDTRLTEVDLGIGVPLGFSSIDHQASHTVWGSVLRAGGRIDVPFVWTPETGIRPN